MGVTGLWRLIEPAGKPVPVETLENKVLAVDISIWLHQMVKGYQDAKGAPLPNAHLMGLFQRLCKLLYFRIKPVFVFDGGFPDLKKETIAKRQDNKSKYNSQSEKLKREIALLLGKKTAINALLGKQISPKKNKQVENNDIFKLPALPEREMESESESEDDLDQSSTSTSWVDLHTIDLESDDFKNLPLKEKYDLLVELKETRKMNSWGKLHTLPKKSDNFSDFQMQRLLKRRKLQECMEETEKEMGDGCMSLNELESLLNEEGIDTKVESLPSRRIASNDTTRYLLISDVKQALEDAKKKELAKQKEENEDESKKNCATKTSTKHDELEDDLQKAIKMSLECVEDQDTSACTSKGDDSWTSCLTDSDYSDDNDNDGFEQPDITSAKAYIMQYSDLTHKAIDELVIQKQKEQLKQKGSNIEKIIEELNQEKTIIEDNIDLMSSDDDVVENKTDKIKSSNTIKSECNVTNERKLSIEQANTKIEEKLIENDKADINDTQASLVCMENSTDEVISLDTSTEDVHESISTKIEMVKSALEQSLKESSSSEDEFEEVSDNNEKPKKPIIELTLNMGAQVEDDIFADIFDKTDKKDIQELPSAETVMDEEKLAKNKIDHIDTSVAGLELNKTIPKKLNVIDNQDVAKSKPKEKKGITTICTPDAKEDDEFKAVQNNAKQKVQTIATHNKVTNESNENSKTSENNVILKEKLNSMATEIEVEEESLIQEKGRLDRIGRNITEQMTKEAQELLQVFGIPYIIAPMEAEAQCAFLESVKLTDGTITDDSDIWLFGGRTVYKNFFNQKKHVLQFLSERIENAFNLTREQLILLALLVGSDYTTGVQGVGPVTALEILASFPFNKKKLQNEYPNKQALYQELVIGLQEFKKWVRAGKRTDNTSLKKKLKNVTLTDDFPSVRVVQAYLEPNIEKSEEKFTWGEIDITVLRDYTKSKFGWSQHKLDEIIKPVLKRLLERKTQKTVHDYFKRKIDFQSLEEQMSKRVKAAVQKMGPEMDDMQELNEKEVPKAKKRKAIKSKNVDDCAKAGPSKAKQSKNDDLTEIEQVVKSSLIERSEFDIDIPKSDRVQEIIPQRERDKKHLLENKLKAIEIFRKTKIDPKKKTTKRKLPVPKEDAELSESDSD